MSVGGPYGPPIPVLPGSGLGESLSRSDWVQAGLPNATFHMGPRSLGESGRSCVMKVLGGTAARGLILVGGAGGAPAARNKDESGHGGWGGGYERTYGGPGRGYGYDRPRRERRAFKE